MLWPETWANHSWRQPPIRFGQMENRRESVMTAAIAGITTPLICPTFPLFLLPPSLALIHFFPSVFSACFFLRSTCLSLQNAQTSRRLPSPQEDLNTDDDKCPNLSRAISILGAEGEGAGQSRARPCVCQHHIPRRSINSSCLSFAWHSVSASIT